MQALFIRFSCLMPVFDWWCQSSFETRKLFVQLLHVPIAIWNYQSRFWKHSFTYESVHKLLM